MLNPIYGLCPYMVFGSGFPVPTVLNSQGNYCIRRFPGKIPGKSPGKIPGKIMVFGSDFPACPNCVESYGLWVRFPCPTVLNPIYGLCPYMVFGSGFPVPTVLNPMIFGSIRFPCLTVLNPIYGLCPYMVFGSGFPVPTVLNPMVFGSGFPVPLC